MSKDWPIQIWDLWITLSKKKTERKKKSINEWRIIEVNQYRYKIWSIDSNPV